MRVYVLRLGYERRKTMIYDDYINYSDEYRRKYGERTVVLMEVGSFFEIYAVQNKEETSGADIAQICDLCNLQLSRKNKAVVESSRANPLMAGFPSFALSKHTQLLLANDYTVVLIRQVTAPPNPRREVTEILSPGLQLCPQGIDGSWLFVSYWDSGLTAGFCGMDVSTGQTWVYEVAGTALCLDELSRCVSMYQPRELVVLGSRTLSSKDQDAISQTLRGATTHLLWEAAHSDGANYAKVSYQNAVLRKSFPERDFGVLSPLEVLDLEKFDNVRTAFTFMIQFGYEHNQNIIQYLQKPTHLTFDKRCNLEHTSAVQLQLISSGSSNGCEKPLFGILSRCATAFGARAFKSRLLEPTYDSDELTSRYDKIESFIKNIDINGVHRALRGVLDMERMARRMLLGTFSPTDWPSYHLSMQGIASAAALIGTLGMGMGKELISITDRIKSDYVDTLNLDECAKYLIGDIKGNIFKVGVYPEVDEIAHRRSKMWDTLQHFADYLSKLANDAKDSVCHIEFNDRDGYHIQVTKRRWETIKTALARVNVESHNIDGKCIKSSEFEAKPISSSSSVLKVTHRLMCTKSDEIIKADHMLATMVTKTYKEFLKQFAESNSVLMQECTQLVADLDVTVACARNAIDFKYVRPRLGKSGGTGSWVDAKGMRHPILERLHEKVMYVPNDIMLGSVCDDSKRKQGLLLFGVNSSGKSSLMKAIGLNVIMAQAGMYVAADSFEFEPYRHVFTRIAGMDDIYRGWSTFTVEMMELRNILGRADARSLVLGDEVCSGTESLSATAIVAAGIETLVAKGTTFVFATHLHDLSKMPRITESPAISLCHMHVECESGGTLVYDRRLRPGVGTGVYGLEVCRGLDLPAEFLRLSHEIRCELSGQSAKLVDPRQSRYNAGVLMDTCKLCGAHRPSETHHIAPQMNADAAGFIDHYHKNQAFNLIPVCETCHDAIHAGRIDVKGFKDTSAGLKLVHTDINITIPEKVAKYVRLVDGQWQTRKTVRSKWREVSAEEATVILQQV